METELGESTKDLLRRVVEVEFNSSACIGGPFVSRERVIDKSDHSFEFAKICK